MSFESTNRVPKSWEKERLPGTVTLNSFANSPLHEQIDNDSESFQAVFEMAGRSLKNLAYVHDDMSTIFVAKNIEALDGDEFDTLTTGSEIIGYGTGNGYVGFAPADRVKQTIKGLAIRDDVRLSLFVPVPVTKDMLQG